MKVLWPERLLNFLFRGTQLSYWVWSQFASGSILSMAMGETNLRMKPTTHQMVEQKKRNQVLFEKVIPVNQPTLKSDIPLDFFRKMSQIISLVFKPCRVIVSVNSSQKHSYHYTMCVVQFLSESTLVRDQENDS